MNTVIPPEKIHSSRDSVRYAGIRPLEPNGLIRIRIIVINILISFSFLFYVNDDSFCFIPPSLAAKYEFFKKCIGIDHS